MGVNSFAIFALRALLASRYLITPEGQITINIAQLITINNAKGE